MSNTSQSNPYYCKPEWFKITTAIYIVLRTDTYQLIMQAEYAMAENTWLVVTAGHTRVWPTPVTASANTIEMRTLGIDVSCCSVKRILMYTCHAGDCVTSGHVIQRPGTVTTARVSMDKITQAYTIIDDSLNPFFIVKPHCMYRYTPPCIQTINTPLIQLYSTIKRHINHTLPLFIIHITD